VPEKSSVEEIRARFDADVERFSDLETGQTATMDAPLMLELATQAAVAVTPKASRVLDLGCGAGNYTLKLLEALAGDELGQDRLGAVTCTLVDLSRPMLDRAVERVSAATPCTTHAIQGDLREIDFGQQRYDIILAAMVLHHLRDESEWHATFAKLHASLAPGGSLWIVDMVDHDEPAVRALMRERYGAYLTALRNEAYRDYVFAYIEREDSPRSVVFQMAAMSRAGFSQVQVLHKQACFAALGGVASGL